MSRQNLLAFKWQGKKIKDSVLSLEMKDVPNSVIKNFYFGRGSRTYQALGNKTLQLTGEKGIHFFVNDLEKGSVTRVRHFRKEKESEINSVYVIQAGDDAELKTILDALGNPETQLTSTLPKPPRANTVSKTTVRLLSRGKQHGNDWYGTPYFTDCHEDVDFDEGGLYIPLLRDKAIDADRNKIENFLIIVQEAYNMGLLDKDEVIYGASPKVLKEFTGSEEWENAFDVIKERFLSKVDKEDLKDKIATYANWQEWNNHQEGYQVLRHCGYTNQKFMEQKLGKDHELAKFEQKIAEGRKLSSVTDRNDTMARYLGVDVVKTQGTPEYDYVGTWKALLAKYPMLMVMHYPRNGDEKYLIDYIQTMDKLA
jgi:hypothetical protein